MPQATEIRPENKAPIERAMVVVCDVFGVTRHALLGRKRSGPEYRARQAFCLIVYEDAGIPTHEIGSALSRGGSAGRALIASITREMANDAELAEQVHAARSAFRRWLNEQATGAAA
jgi:chromosomal replication initiation ATPase DnaA